MKIGLMHDGQGSLVSGLGCLGNGRDMIILRVRLLCEVVRDRMDKRWGKTSFDFLMIPMKSSWQRRSLHQEEQSDYGHMECL